MKLTAVFTASLLLAASTVITFVAGANIYIGSEYDGDDCMGHQTDLWYDVDQSEPLRICPTRKDSR